MISATDEPPYPLNEPVELSFTERLPLICKQWAYQRNMVPFAILAPYSAKYFLLFIGGWAFFVSRSAGYAGFFEPSAWAFTDVAFQKVVLWAMLYESLGLGLARWLTC